MSSVRAPLDARGGIRPRQQLVRTAPDDPDGTRDPVEDELPPVPRARHEPLHVTEGRPHDQVRDEVRREVVGA